MPGNSTSLREAHSAANPENPAVVNVRRPNIAKSEHARLGAHYHVEPHPADDARQPQTVLRLPDLAAAVKRWSRPQLRIGAIAQWAAIALGGLLAAWLIFGGRPPSTRDANESQTAPAWAPAARNLPAPSSAPAAPAKSTAEPTAPGLPDWNDPNWSAGASAAPPAGGAPRESIRTAQRPERPASNPAAGPASSDARPLDITVPVQQ
jgi:hypothetical protein